MLRQSFKTRFSSEFGFIVHQMEKTKSSLVWVLDHAKFLTKVRGYFKGQWKRAVLGEIQSVTCKNRIILLLYSSLLRPHLEAAI